MPLIAADAHLIGLWLQLLATGAYFVYAANCIGVLRRKVRDGLSLWLPLACGIFFALTMTDLIVEMIRGYHAFAVQGGERPDPVTFFADASSPESLVKNSIIVIQAIISDMIMVYRTFVVWNCSFLIILVPAGLLLVDTAMGIWAVWSLSQTKTGDVLILAEVTVRTRYLFIIAFTLNVLCASLICWKIWRVHSRISAHMDSRPLSHVVEVILESAVIYCVYLFVIIVTDSVGSNLFFAFLDPLPPVISIIFSMIIVRVQTTKRAGSSWNLSSLRIGGSRSDRSATAVSGMEIHLERVARTETDSIPRSYPRSDASFPSAEQKDNVFVADV